MINCQVSDKIFKLKKNPFYKDRAFGKTTKTTTTIDKNNDSNNNCNNANS